MPEMRFLEAWLTPKRPQGEQRPYDPNQVGKLIVDISVGEIDDPVSAPESKGKNSQAVALDRKCGRARAAAVKRWGKE